MKSSKILLLFGSLVTLALIVFFWQKARSSRANSDFSESAHSLTSGTRGPVASAKDSPLDDSSWLPKNSRYSEEAGRIPEGAELVTMIPKDEPLSQKGTMKITENFELYPDPENRTAVSISGGALVSKVGEVEKKAIFRDWDFLYEDSAFTKPMTKWGPCLTSGQLLVERSAFTNSAEGVFARNFFVAESFGDRYVLITLDPAKGHRLCYLQSRGGHVFTGGLAGTRAEVDGRTLEKRADGWHLAKVETRK